MSGTEASSAVHTVTTDKRLTEWLDANVSDKDRKRFGMAYTPKPVSELIARHTIEHSKELGLIRKLPDGRDWLPMLEPFAGIGIMVEDVTEVCIEKNIMPCIIAYELNALAAKECQRRNPHAYVVNTDTFFTPTFVQLQWEEHFMNHFIRKHTYNVNEDHPEFEGWFTEDGKTRLHHKQEHGDLFKSGA